jgi:hypothetical protein
MYSMTLETGIETDTFNSNCQYGGPANLMGFVKDRSHQCKVLSKAVNVRLWKYEDFMAIGDLHLRGVVQYSTVEL